MQISDDVIVVTGGDGTYDYVTEYQLADVTETNLTSLVQPRYAHACGVYQDADDQHVSKRFYSRKECGVQIMYYILSDIYYKCCLSDILH